MGLAARLNSPIAFEHDPILSLIGNTPLVRLHGKGAGVGQYRVDAKCEFANPSGSGKARPALAMIDDAIRRGLVVPGMSFLDAGSGGTAEAEALVSCRRGWPLTIVASESTPKSKLAAVKAYGATVVTSPAAEGSEGARRMAAELALREPRKYCFLNQYENWANPFAQRQTGEEIYKQTSGRVKYIFIGVGTGGTSMGIAATLKGRGVKLIGVIPDSQNHTICGLKFLTRENMPGILDLAVFHVIVKVSSTVAWAGMDYLAKEEGLLVGPSSGAVFSAWMERAQEISQDSTVLMMHDTGAKYLSEAGPANRA